MQIGMRHHRHRLIKERSSLFLGRSDQDPIQPEFALPQKQKTASQARMLSHLAEHQDHKPKLKKAPLKNF